MSEADRPKVGVGVMIFKDGKVLLSQRLRSHAKGEYGGCGGHLEYMESLEDCARRETREEAGIEIENIRLLCVSNTKKHAPKHYVDIGLIADWKSGEPRVLEPEKHSPWEWYDLDALPEPLFDIMAFYIQAHKTGQNFFDIQWRKPLNP